MEQLYSPQTGVLRGRASPVTVNLQVLSLVGGKICLPSCVLLDFTFAERKVIRASLLFKGMSINPESHMLIIIPVGFTLYHFQILDICRHSLLLWVLTRQFQALGSCSWVQMSIMDFCHVFSQQVGGKQITYGGFTENPPSSVRES